MAVCISNDASDVRDIGATPTSTHGTYSREHAWRLQQAYRDSRLCAFLTMHPATRDIEAAPRGKCKLCGSASQTGRTPKALRVAACRERTQRHDLDRYLGQDHVRTPDTRRRPYTREQGAFLTMHPTCMTLGRRQRSQRTT
ncbi:uncharacterized protein LOC142590128 isoform X1 [Dermacentor variabilis]|uniref:uncharacterized protein LOC142590128 isoform X1 n=1 Tax=Dermacentor variabilis TaxID=34621 RepID=UPI003F5B567C